VLDENLQHYRNTYLLTVNTPDQVDGHLMEISLLSVMTYQSNAAHSTAANTAISLQPIHTRMTQTKIAESFSLIF